MKGEPRMTLPESVRLRLENPQLGRDERARLRCRLAEELEQRGQYEAARSALAELWQGICMRPMIDGLDEQTAAEVLLRAGALSGWLGSASQIVGAQEAAKDMIGESIALFVKLKEPLKADAARSELALCYWREGAFGEARLLLEDVFSRLGEESLELRAKTLLRRVLIEISTGRFQDALYLLADAAPIFEACPDQLLKGRFREQLAHVLKSLGASEHRRDYIDRAIVEYAAATEHFEQADHAGYRAEAENNLGHLLLVIGRDAEALDHLDRARSLFLDLKESRLLAQVDEARARLLLRQGRTSEAEQVISESVRVLEQVEEHSLLASSLTVQGVVLARLDRLDQSYTALESAMNIARHVGTLETAGRAALSLLEEHAARMTYEERRDVYARADEWLEGTRDTEDVSRLRTCARRLMASGPIETPARQSSVSFIHASEETAAMLERAERLAHAELPVLLTGETGVGKEVLARLIHHWSGRAGSFVTLNCGALTERQDDAQQSEGAPVEAVTGYTDAVRKAAGGTLFLEEISALTLADQGKLLHLIEAGEIMPMGAHAPEHVNVRIVASTNASLSKLLAEERFREDLFYRITPFELEISPLRERPDDLLALAQHFVQQISEREGREVDFAPGSLESLKGLPLYGNARELRAIIEHAASTSKGQPIREDAFKLLLLRATGKGTLFEPWQEFSLPEEVLLYEERLIARALREAQGKVTHAARLLGLSHQTLTAILESRHTRLQAMRTPVQTRRRSIIKRK
jgi:DNA-binding NtrC family response regulator